MKKFVLLVMSTVVVSSFAVHKARNRDFHYADSCGRDKLLQELNAKINEEKKLLEKVEELKGKNYNVEQYQREVYAKDIRIKNLIEENQRLREKDQSSITSKANSNKKENEHKNQNNLEEIKLKEKNELLKSKISSYKRYYCFSSGMFFVFMLYCGCSMYLLFNLSDQNKEYRAYMKQFEDSVCYKLDK